MSKEDAAYCRPVSRTEINTFDDIIYSVGQFINSAFSEGDTVQVVSEHFENDIPIKAGE